MGISPRHVEFPSWKEIKDAFTWLITIRRAYLSSDKYTLDTATGGKHAPYNPFKSILDIDLNSIKANPSEVYNRQTDYEINRIILKIITRTQISCSLI